MGKLNRRDFITAVATVPSLGAASEPKITSKESREPKKNKKTETIRIGIIGFGFRGEQLARATKFAHPDWIREQGAKSKNNIGKTILKAFNDQEDLNIEYGGISDLFDTRMKRGLTVAGNIATGHKNYRDMLARKDIEAVIIASPDHWHSQMAIDAANAGKHIYLEKCMTRTEGEAVALRNAVKKNNVVFQLGHQGRQRDLNQKAKDLIAKGTLGKITLIETTPTGTIRLQPGYGRYIKRPAEKPLIGTNSRDRFLIKFHSMLNTFSDGAVIGRMAQEWQAICSPMNMTL